ncbi:hypothetical protein F4823DRAFT_569035 [Ustulina deusta]|nr:hypothetical protein F4823DRAFT_569035 [Ustulina deusta]
MEALGAVASIVQLTTIAASIIKTIHRIHDEAKEGLTRAFRRTTELESLLAILHLIKSSQPLTPDTFQVPLLIVHEHLHEFLAKTENKIIEGLNNLERAKNSLILHLSATQGRTLEQILEKMNKLPTQFPYGYNKGTVTNQRRLNFSASFSPFAGASAFPTDEAADTLDYTLDHRQQGHMIPMQTEDISPEAHRASQHEDQIDIDDPAGEESPTTAPYDNANHSFIFTGSNNRIEPPQGSVECHIGNTFNAYPSTREIPMWKWTGTGNNIIANKLGNNINFANQTSSSTSTQSTSARRPFEPFISSRAISLIPLSFTRIVPPF